MTKAPWSMIELFRKRWSAFNPDFPYVRDDMTGWSFEASPLAGEVREPRQHRERVPTPTRCNVWNEATRRRSRGDGTRIKIEARWKVNFWRIDLTLFITVFLYRTLTSRAREPTSRQYEGETEISFIIYNNMRDGGIGWYENTFFCPIILRCHVLYLLLEGTGIENKINSNLLPFRTRYWDLRQNSRVQKNINVYNWEKVFKKSYCHYFYYTSRSMALPFEFVFIYGVAYFVHHYSFSSSQTNGTLPAQPRGTNSRPLSDDDGDD